MSSMRERVARAISNADNGLDGDPIGVMLDENFRIEGDTREECDRQLNIVLLAAADAVLEAMREPDEIMMHEGGYAVSDPTDECRDEDETRARTVWQTMIAARAPCT